jgi:hypothetical protein
MSRKPCSLRSLPSEILREILVNVRPSRSPIPWLTIFQLSDLDQFNAAAAYLPFLQNSTALAFIAHSSLAPPPLGAFPYDYQSRLRHQVETSLKIPGRGALLQSFAILSKGDSILRREDKSTLSLQGLARLQYIAILQLLQSNAPHLKRLYLGIDVGFRLLMDLDLNLEELESLTLRITKHLWIFRYSSLQSLTLLNVDCEVGAGNFARVPKLPLLKTLSIHFSAVSKRVLACDTETMVDLDDFDSLQELYLYSTIMQASPLILKGSGRATVQNILIDGPFVFESAHYFSQFLERFQDSRRLRLSLRGVQLTDEPHTSISLYRQLVALELFDVGLVSLLPSLPPNVRSLCIKSSGTLNESATLCRLLRLNVCGYLHLESPAGIVISTDLVGALLENSSLSCLRLLGPKYFDARGDWERCRRGCLRLENSLLQGPISYKAERSGVELIPDVPAGDIYLLNSETSRLRTWRILLPSQYPRTTEMFLRAADRRKKLRLTWEASSRMTHRPLYAKDGLNVVFTNTWPENQLRWY